MADHKPETLEITATLDGGAQVTFVIPNPEANDTEDDRPLLDEWTKGLGG